MIWMMTILGNWRLPHLLLKVSKQTELARNFAAGKLTAIEVHTPRAAKGKRRSAGVLVQTLACTRTTVGMRWRGEDREVNKAGEVPCNCKTPKDVLTLH